MDPLSPTQADYVVSAKAGIESIEYIDDLVREYLLFRGFDSTLQALERDLGQDRDYGFRADRMADELLNMAQKLCIDEMQEYWKYLCRRFFSRLSPKYQRTTKMFERRLLRLFLVSAIQQGQRQAIRAFMDEHGLALSQQGGDWVPWLGLEYIAQPQARSEFEAYFADEWLASLRAALTDFLQTVFPAAAVPRILLFDRERRKADALQRRLEIYERGEARVTARGPESGPVGLVEDHIGRAPHTELAATEADENADPEPAAPVGGLVEEEPARQLRICQQDVFLEHNAGIGLARFSPSAELIASYDDESVLKVWAPDPTSSAPALKNELDFAVSAMAWDQRHTHLLYMYDDAGFIHTLNTQSNLFSRHPVATRRHPWIHCMLPAASMLLNVCSTQPESTADVAVQLWDPVASRTTALRRLPPAPETHGVCASLNHNGNLAAVAFGSGRVHVLDTRSLESVATHDTAQHDLCAVEFSLDEDALMAVTETGALTLWSLRAGCHMLAESALDLGPAATIPPESRLDCDRVAFTPDRQSVVVAPQDHCLVFNVDSAALTDRTRRHKGLVSVIDVAADRSLSASEDGTVRVAQYRRV
ncbi:hypothetical protein IWW36_002624 [Coemansia brasiliensis]|uniref:ARMC9 CTLH-like domain-containing protein n=1 Tax=Coemansia brasiliensis TaxID=2650707 RepID=A0A9W8LZA8_9FUNG|nr:hypothetical protein IWW36_002624 [Coemansia brasiliensis]